MTAELLNGYFIPLFLIVGFSLKLWRQRGSMDKSLRYHWLTIISTLVLIIADSLEYWAQADPSRRFVRLLFSVIGYIMRPTAALSIVLIVYPKIRRPFWLWIPDVINALVYSTAFYSGIAFGFHEDTYSFFRGPLGYTVFAVSFLYIATAVVLTWIGFRDKDHTRERIIFLYMFLRSIDTNRDPLTKLLNRISFYDDCGRLGASISAIASLDMNGLKYMNDSMGHEAGDEALKTIGMNLQEIRNNRILPYRIGGDEFAILFIRQDEEVVKSVLSDLKQRIQAKGYNVATGYTMRGLSSASVQDLVRWADEKMYAEKAKFYSENKHDRRRSGR